MSDINICPICVERMTDMGAQYVCKSCGYKLSKTAYAASYVNISNETAAKKADTKSAGGSVKKGMSAKKLLTVLTTLSTAAGLVYGVIPMVNDFNSSVDGSNEVVDSGKHQLEAVSSQAFPDSDFFQSLCQSVFNCPFDEVSNAQLAKFTALHINPDDNLVEVTVDGTTKTLSYSSSLRYDYSDLNYFTGLETLIVDGDSLPELKALTKLKVVGSSNSIDELADIVYSPEQITGLSSVNPHNLATLDGLAYFPKLQSLYVKSSELVDISGINYLENPVSITIENADNLTNFTALGSLKNLQALSLGAKKLKNIDFVKNMKKLNYLYIGHSAVSDINALSASKDNMTSLFLEDNYYIKDYTVISELTKLKSLMLYRDFESALPDFSKLKSLDTLYISKIEQFEPLTALSELTHLTIKSGLLHRYEGIEKLKKLVYLKLDDTNAYISNLHDLMGAVSLETLDISSLGVFGHIEEVLSLPNLTTFAMDDATVCLDFTKLKKNPKLLCLSMNDVKLVDYDFDERGEADTTTRREVELSDTIEGLAAFPNLSVLSVSGNNLNNLDFIKELKYLQVLDISDNYITDISPLAGLKNLVSVNCDGNTIVKGADKLGNVEIQY